MLETSSKTNLLEQKTYRYSLQDVDEPNLYRDIYPYTDVPRVAFNHRRVPMNMPTRQVIIPSHGPQTKPSISSTGSPGMNATKICKSCIPSVTNQPSTH